MEKAVEETLVYFHFFDYSPTFEEIYTFLPQKIFRKKLQSMLDDLKHNNGLLEKAGRYTLGEYQKKVQSSKFKVQSWRNLPKMKRNG